MNKKQDVSEPPDVTEHTISLIGSLLLKQEGLSDKEIIAYKVRFQPLFYSKSSLQIK